MSPDKNTLDELRIDRTTQSRPKPRLFLMAAAVVIMLLGLAVAWWLRREGPVEVHVYTVREAGAGASSQAVLLNASGYVVARRQATVSAKVTGKVAEVLIEEGMKVKAGQVLARLDSSNVETSMRLAEAQLHAARAALDETKARLDQAQREFQRAAQLAKAKIASESDLDR